MQAIVPYEIMQWPGAVVLEMPQGAQILSVQVHGGTPFLWALTDPHQPLAEFVLHVLPSFEHFRPDEQATDYIGTFQDPCKEAIVANAFHVFRARPTKSLRELEEQQYSDAEDYR